MDESELEVERLEGVRRKVLRDLEEQQELQEALQAKVTALESELKYECSCGCFFLIRTTMVLWADLFSFG